MQTTLILLILVFNSVCLGQTELKTKIQALESEIKSVEKEISSLESSRDQELNAQQLLINEKQKQENRQQQIVDQINDDDYWAVKRKISEYGVNQNQISLYKELLDKELYVARSSDKKLTKFIEAIKESNTILYSHYRMVCSSKNLYILCEKGKVRFQKIEFSEKEQKQFNKLREKEILLSVGEAKASYLKNETGLDEQYFILFDKKNNEETLLKKETLKLNEFKSQKQKLVKFKDGIATTFNGQIAEKRLITEKLNKVIKSKIQIEKFNKSLEKCTIGNQVWMSTNLDVTHFRNGDEIVQAQAKDQWLKALFNKVPAWCYNEECGEKCGKLYNWWAVIDPRGLAPDGWHIPSYDEWDDFEKVTYNYDDDGRYLIDKEFVKSLKCTNGWGSTTEQLKCMNCIDWNDTYRSNKRGCDKCKDTKKGKKITISCNGNNKSGFNSIKSGHRGRLFLINSGGFGAQQISIPDLIDDNFDFWDYNSTYWSRTPNHESIIQSEYSFVKTSYDPWAYHEMEGYYNINSYEVYFLEIDCKRIELVEELFSIGASVRCIKDDEVSDYIEDITKEDLPEVPVLTKGRETWFDLEDFTSKQDTILNNYWGRKIEIKKGDFIPPSLRKDDDDF